MIDLAVKQRRAGHLGRSSPCRFGTDPNPAIHTGPAGDQSGDVLLLARHFLSEIGPAHGKGVPHLTAAAAAALDAYAFSSNVRELRNLIERALSLSPAG